MIDEIKKFRKSDVKKKIDSRLKEFESLNRKNTKHWFSELCFCILTANSKAQTALKIQDELKAKGFCECTSGDVKKCIIKHKHRFHNNKTKYIIEARNHLDIKKKIISIKDEKEKREWLVKNIKGIGYKEASHFLRNVGYKNLAILDRHILNLMVENKILKEKPKSLTKKMYLKIEDKFNSIADRIKISPAELDMYMWYMKTGKVLK